MGSPLDQVSAALPAYEIGEELGRGSAGVVLAARHRQLGRDVAVKLLYSEVAAEPEVRRRFVAEAKLLASFSHIHIVPVYDYVEQEGLCLLVLERLHGGTLHAYAGGGMDAPSACAAVVALCSALHYAHERQVLHRDVKPANVLIADEGLVKVTDFGIAKVLGGSQTLATRTGFVLGTPAYMAPEQAEGGDPGPATDVYAAGTVLYELLAGRLPYPPESNPLQMLYSHVHSDPKPLREVAPAVPAELAAVVMRALARDPAERFASAEEFAVGIGAAAANIWGADWLSETPFKVAAPGPILSAARGATPTTGGVALPETVDIPAAPPATGAPHAAGAPPGEPPPTVPPPPAPPTAAEPSDGPPPGGRPRRRLAIALAVVAALAVAGGAVALLAGGDDDGGSPPAASPAAPLGDSNWESLRQAAPLPQQQMASALVGKIAYLAGGLQNKGGDAVATRQVQRLDTEIELWSRAPELPVRLHHAAAVNFQDELVVIGGWIADGSDLAATTSDRVFVLSSGKWEAMPRLNIPRAAGAAAVVDGRIVVTGGLGEDGLVEPTEVFDGEKWTEAADMPTPREHLAVAADDRFLYAVGGRDAGGNLKTLERYDPAQDDWQPLPDMGTARNGLGAAVLDGHLFAVGGETAEVLPTVEAYDIGRERWSKVDRLPQPRHGLAVLAAGGRVFALAGAVGLDHTGTTTLAEALPVAND